MNKGLRLDLSKVEPYVKLEQELNHMEAMVKSAHDTLKNGTGAGNDFLGWLDLPVNYDKNEFERIKNAAEKIKKNSDALIVASCTINRDAPKVIWNILSSIDAINTKNKYAGAIGSYGWSGEAINMIKDRLTSLNFKFIDDGIRVVFKPTKDDLTKVSNYALDIASKLS